VDISQSSFSRISGLEESTGVEEERYFQQLRSLAMMWEMRTSTFTLQLWERVTHLIDIRSSIDSTLANIRCNWPDAKSCVERGPRYR
jgi:hypothetical protein